METNLEPAPLELRGNMAAELSTWLESPRAGDCFANPWEHAPLPRLGDVLRWRIQKNEHRARSYEPLRLSVPRDALADFEALRGSATRLLWIGHASFMVELAGTRMVIDPIFGRAAGVVPRLSPAAARAEELGEVRAVLVTHGHHDHLDPASLRALAKANPDRTVFVVPEGLGASLPRVCRPLVELRWWEHVVIEGVRVHLVPAQHWHGRTPFDRNQALWGGYVIEREHRVYHSGDTGYFGGFAAVRRVFGGVDVACLPLGAYEPRWFMSTQHMGPEESLRAYQDLGATHFVGMHWGAFDLSDEPIDAGPRWLRAAVTERALASERFHVLAPGGSIALSGAPGNARADAHHAWASE